MITDSIRYLVHITHDLNSLESILKDGALKVGEKCPIKTIQECNSAVYLSAIFDENIGAELQPGAIYLVFSPEILEETRSYHLSNGIFHGEFRKNRSYRPEDIQQFILAEKRQFAPNLKEQNPNNNELVLYEDLPLKHLIAIWIAPPSPKYLLKLVKKKEITAKQALEEIDLWDLVRSGLSPPPEDSLQWQAEMMLRYSGLKGYLKILSFPSTFQDI